MNPKKRLKLRASQDANLFGFEFHKTGLLSESSVSPSFKRLAGAD